jgi:hypothetical protein
MIPQGLLLLGGLGAALAMKSRSSRVESAGRLPYAAGQSGNPAAPAGQLDSTAQLEKTMEEQNELLRQLMQQQQNQPAAAHRPAPPRIDRLRARHKPPPPRVQAPAPPPPSGGGGGGGGGGGADLGKTLGDVASVASTVLSVFGAGADPAAVAPVVAVNPMWLQLGQVLSEVSAGFHMTGVPLRSDQETFLRVVDHLAQVVNGLAQTPNDPALLAEYNDLSTFLSAHPDSVALAAFIETHPKIAPTMAVARATEVPQYPSPPPYFFV